MSNRPLVSVVIPAYNAAGFIRDALDSVLAQTYRPIEVLVADDGSTDDTAAVAASYGTPVGCLRQANKGPAGARNLALRHARGELIAFLDADDVWHPRKLEVQVPFLVARPTAGLCGSLIAGFRDAAQLDWQDAATDAVWERVPHVQIVLRNQFNTSTVMARTRAVREAGGFDEDIFGPEDWDLWRRVMQRWEAVRLNAVLVAYRVRRGSVSSNAARMLANNRKVLRKAFADNPDLPWQCRRRAVSYMHFDAALEWLDESAWRAAGELLTSLLLWPLPLGEACCRPLRRAKIAVRIALELTGTWRLLKRRARPPDGGHDGSSSEFQVAPDEP